MKDFRLETERLIIRPFRIEDAEEVLVFASNKEIIKTTGGNLLTTLEEVREMIQKVWLWEYSEYGYARYAVIHKEDGNIIGFNGLKYIPEINLPDFGYRLLPKYWGKGLATESSKAVLKYAFETLPLEKMAGFTYTDNFPSINVLKKVGFQFWKLDHYPGEEGPLINWYHLARADYEG